MKLRRLRDGDSLDGSALLVRGGELDAETLRADAVRYFTVYGCYGISVFALRGLSLDELAQQVLSTMTAESKSSANTMGRLSTRERQIAYHVARGMKNKDIGEALAIAEGEAHK